MFSIYLRTIKNYAGTLIIYCGLGLAFVWMYVALFPTIQEQSGELAKLLESFPPAFMEAFGLSAENSALFFSNLEAYMATEMFGFIWPIMVIVLMAMVASSSIAGEVESGTAELLLSLPVSRLQIFFGKYLAGLKLYFIFALVSIFSIPFVAQIYAINVDLPRYLTVFAVGSLFAVAILSLATLLASVFSEKGKVALLTSGLLMLMYVLNVVSGLQESLENLKYFSFFHYYNIEGALIHHVIETETIVFFVAVIVGCTGLAAWVFSRRDL